MKQTPVGIKCEDCASIGKPKILIVSKMNLLYILLNSIILSIGLGFLLSLFLWIIWNFLPISNFQIGNIFFAVIIALLGSQVGEIIRKISRKKISSKIRIISGFSMFLVWFSSIIFSTFLSLPLGIYFNIINLIGLGIGSYIAMNKNRN
ncbi:MAG: hypothetical protein CL748_04390 [Chloroflexi bacterium]|nr:hypothetical protein [Chloroflexota bacterium]